MKTKIIFLLLIFIISLSGCRFWGVRGSGDIESENRDLEVFDAIEASGAFNIDISVGEEQSIIITADDNLLKYIVTKVRGGKLIIDSKRNLNPKKEILVKIKVKELNYIESSGACDFYIDGINSEHFKVNASGASDLTLKGNCDKFYISLSGAGNVKARDFIAKNVKVDISGASDADVFASESLDAEVSGVGSVNYYGNPDKVSSDISGVGSINRK